LCREWARRSRPRHGGTVCDRAGPRVEVIDSVVTGGLNGHVQSPALKGKYVSSSSRAPLIVFGAAFLLVGGIFIYIGGSNLLEQRRYRQQGVQVEAVATGKALRRATTTTDTAYEISYQFNLPGGSRYQQTESVSVPLWERVEQGSP